MSQNRYLRIRDFDEQLHYKDRNPIWIKMPCALLNNYYFDRLDDQTKFHAMGLILLASQINNKFPEDAAWLSKKIGAQTEINLEILIESGFLEVITSGNSSTNTSKKAGEKRKIGCKSNKTQDESASILSQTLLAQNRAEQNKKEQNTPQQNKTEHATTEQNRRNETRRRFAGRRGGKPRGWVVVG